MFDLAGVGADEVGECGSWVSKPDEDSLRRNSTHRCEND